MTESKDWDKRYKLVADPATWSKLVMAGLDQLFSARATMRSQRASGGTYTGTQDFLATYTNFLTLMLDVWDRIRFHFDEDEDTEKITEFARNGDRLEYSIQEDDEEEVHAELCEKSRRAEEMFDLMISKISKSGLMDLNWRANREG